MRTKKHNTNTPAPIAPLYKPRTVNQKLYVQHLTDSTVPIVLGIGPAGSGKTLFACNQAVLALKSGEVDKIILTRPVVPVEEDLGFLPGSMMNKMDPWTRPVFDILLEFYSKKEVETMVRDGVFEISPLAYMRGRTFKNAFVIADEMQNSSPNQMLMLTTRIGENSKLVITGDLNQSDRGVNNGLADLMRKIRSYSKPLPDIQLVELTGIDIQRSPIVAKLLDIYDEKPVTPHVTPIVAVVSSSSPSSALSAALISESNKRPIFDLKTGKTIMHFSDSALLPADQLVNSSKYPWTPRPI